MRLRPGQRRATFLFPHTLLAGSPNTWPWLQMTLLTLDPRPDSVGEAHPRIKIALEASVSEVGTTPKWGGPRHGWAQGEGMASPEAPSSKEGKSSRNTQRRMNKGGKWRERRQESEGWGECANKEAQAEREVQT